jgi:hypothetical protein
LNTAPEKAVFLSLDEREAQYAAAAEAAFSAVMDALTTYVAALKQHHGFIQWRQGFSQGWDAHRDHIEKMAAELRDNANIAGLAALSSNNLNAGIPPSPPSLAPKANDLVHQFVQENPGLRGVEIADHFSKAVWRLPERTTRTSLRRLRIARKLKIVEGGWYASEASPADPQLALKE